MLIPPRPRSPCADRKYWATYKVLDILQKVFYRSNPAREAFVEMCESNYVQKMTFDSYLYKTGEPSHGPRARPPAGPVPPLACSCLRPGCLHYGGLLRRPPDVLHTLLASLRATRAAAAELP